MKTSRAGDEYDTRQMTEKTLPGVCSGSFRLDLPGRTFMANKFARVGGANG
jgi:hypothetical protein